MKLSQVTEIDNERFRGMIGQKVWKNPKTTTKFMSKPFKSGKIVNTIKGITNHEQLNCLAFTFEEDESYVACHIVSIAPGILPNKEELIKEFSK
jgi:hypothetical protein